MTRAGSIKVATKDVVDALLGRSRQTLSVQRQAYRLREDHTDELVQFQCGRDFWLAARLGHRVVVWACNDRDAADDAFDERVATEGGWREAKPSEAFDVA